MSKKITDFSAASDSDLGDTSLIPIGNATTGLLKKATMKQVTNHGLGFVVLADAPTINIDCNAGRNFTINGVAGARNVTISNPVEGKRLIVKIISDATGNRSLIFPVNSVCPLGFMDANTLNLSSAGNSIDFIEIIYDGTSFNIFPTFKMV